jgi:uncharacterized membrane protein YidH (DUF202 family)
MGRWLGALAAVGVAVLATLVSGAMVALPWGALWAPGYVFPVVGYGWGALLGHRLYVSRTSAPANPFAAAPNSGLRIDARTRRWIEAGIGLACTAALCMVAAGQPAPLAWGRTAIGEIPAFPLPLVGFGLGYAPAFVTTLSDRPFPTSGQPPQRQNRGVVLAIIALWIASSVAMRVGALDFGQTLVAVLSGSAAIACTWQVVRGLEAGQGFAVESHWGGLGGGLGGWRATSLTTATLLALLLGTVTVLAVIAGPRQTAASSPAPAPAPAAPPHAAAQGPRAAQPTQNRPERPAARTAG